MSKKKSDPGAKESEKAVEAEGVESKAVEDVESDSPVKAFEKSVKSAVGESKTVEDWIKIKKISAPVAAALKRYWRWGQGRILSESEFDGRLAQMMKLPVSRV